MQYKVYTLSLVVAITSLSNSTSIILVVPQTVAVLGLVCRFMEIRLMSLY